MSVLSGVRVVTTALNVPGPLAASYLRDHGARVIKVEPPSGDPLEEFCAEWYEALHQDVLVERLDLKADRGQGRMRALLSDADFLLCSQRPSALSRMHLEASTLLAAGSPTSRLRVLNIVGERARPEVSGHDLTYLARAGLLGGDLPRTLVADVLGAERAFATALLLLRQPPGSSAEVGLFDSLSALIAPLRHGLTGPGALLGGALPAYGLYETRQGRVAVAALEPHFRERLYARLSLSPGSALTEVMRDRTAQEWEAWGASHDVPIVALTRGS